MTRRSKNRICALLLCAALPGLLSGAGSAQDRAAAFRQLSERLAGERLEGLDTPEAVQEQALEILDALVLEALAAGAAPDGEALARRLAELQPETRVGENYRAVPLGGEGSVAALAANFGFAGPAAARIYARDQGGWRRAARIDRFAQRDFFDESLELLPLETADPVFVTVTGRSDGLASGTFAAWRLAAGRLERLWSTDILLRSSYQARPDGLELVYCADFDPARPSLCRRMTRERYAWRGGAWQRVEQGDAPLEPAPPRPAR